KLAPNPKVPDNGRSHWHRYTETRATWSKDRFKAAFPKEKVYRHSLNEEVDALRQVAHGIAADIKLGKIKKPDPCFANLIKLDEEGLLSAYVLYARADEGISHDYASYRAAHRSDLRRYLSSYVATADLSDTPAQKRN